MSDIVNGITGGGSYGNDFKPKAADIIQPVSKEEAQAAQQASLASLQQQQNFLQALQAQNGIGNQSSVYNQLQGIANGTGPNPAQMMLNNTTGQNVANQAALMASQRGSSSNPGLLARQAAMQGAGIQQNAAGQGAALQAQQQQNAINAMGSIAGQQVGQQQNQVNSNTAATQNNQNALLNSIAGVNSANVGMQSNMNNVGAGLAQQQMQNNAGVLGGLMNGVGAAGMFGLKSLATPAAAGGAGALAGGAGDAGIASAAPALMLAAQGGNVQSPTGPSSRLGQYMSGSKPMMAKGGKVPALVSPGEQYLPPEDVKKVKQGANPLSVGERIPGKPKYPGNNYANDVVPKTLEAGGLVIPNEVMQSKDPKKKAAEFVAAHLASKRK